MLFNPHLAKLSDLQPGEQGDCFVLLASRERGTTRDGKPFYRVQLRDADRVVTAMIWSDTPWYEDCDANWRPGQCFKLRGKYDETQYGPQIEIDRIRQTVPDDAADGFNPDDLHPTTPFDVDELFANLLKLAREHIDDAELQQLVTELLHDYAEPLRRLPAASRNHHAYPGGYLEHVVSVTNTAVFLAEKYAAHYPGMQPPLDQSLVVAGAILHDIGKLQELTVNPAGATYSARGTLIGHILLGRDMVREKAASMPNFNAETLLRLEHVIVAHQDRPEWGSPIAPHTPEAMLVHFADDLDAKFHMVAKALEQPPQEGDQFTDRNNALRRPVFRGLADES